MSRVDAALEPQRSSYFEVQVMCNKRNCTWDKAAIKTGYIVEKFSVETCWTVLALLFAEVAFINAEGVQTAPGIPMFNEAFLCASGKH